MPRKILSDAPPDVETPLAAAVTLRDSTTVAMVDEALRHGNVALAFQPVMQAGAANRVAFYEGLIRIYDPTGRIIPARDFILAVENRETGRNIDCAALQLGLAQLDQAPDLRLSVNLSARSIGYPRFMRILRQGLMRDRTVGERLILEITEPSAMLVPELVTGFMADMRRHGISFAIDDFGSGATAFRHLRDCMFDILKIDGQFTRGIAQSPDNQVVTEAILSVARAMDMLTVAEQVENAEDAAWLSRSGVDCLQGYFYAAPTIHPPWEDSARRTGT
ncbi:EAL domain-containing protein [Pseudooceanicola sp. C21-150M6]|uniref:EAL domain-containing protein n=1 Tax=Pseudooceanicola sp. C21-150M6 TaxID=3434355 RepID=UPI003D7FCA48